MNKVTFKKNFFDFHKTRSSWEDSSMDGISVLVSVIESPPHVFIERNKNGTIKGIYGYLAEIWILLENTLKFRTEYIESKNLGQNDNGTWDGMIGDLQFKRADIGLLNLGMTYERQKVIDFSAAIDFDSTKLLKYSTGSDVESIDWLTYVRTFSWDIWFCIGIVWILTSLTLAFVTSRHSDASYFQHLFVLFGVITYQGSETIPERFHGRLIFMSFLLMCVVLYASFTALLTTHLTTASDKPIKSLFEALDLGLRVSLISGSMQHQSVLEGSTFELQRVRGILEKYPSLVVATQENGIESTYDGKTLFLFDSSALRPITTSNCSFSLLLPSFFSGYLHLGYRKKFKYKESLNKSILKLMSSGMMRKLALNWLYPQHSCTKEEEETLSLGVRKTFFAFSLVMGGSVVSIFVLIIEFCIIKARKKQDAKNFKTLSYSKDLKLRF